MTHQVALLPDGRLHLQHGPIDLICRAWGTPGAMRAAYEAAIADFPGILPALCAELEHLRAPLPGTRPTHPVARAMHAACSSVIEPQLSLSTSWSGLTRPTPFTTNGLPGPENAPSDCALRPVSSRGGDTRSRCGEMTEAGPRATAWMVGSSPTITYGGVAAAALRGDAFITPMTAVAGAVADHVLATMAASAPLERAFVNNGGDIAFHLAPTHSLTCALVTTVASPTIDGAFRLHHQSPVRGIATSGRACKGRGGKSFSFGIADSVTILARTASLADAAATVVANATDLPGHPGIQRRPADEIDPDSDLGARLITWHVARLRLPDIERSLDNGRQTADHLIRAGLIEGAVLALQGRIVTCLPARQELAA